MEYEGGIIIQDLRLRQSFFIYVFGEKVVQVVHVLESRSFYAMVMAVLAPASDFSLLVHERALWHSSSELSVGGMH